MSDATFEALSRFADVAAGIDEIIQLCGWLGECLAPLTKSAPPEGWPGARTTPTLFAVAASATPGAGNLTVGFCIKAANATTLTGGNVNGFVHLTSKAFGRPRRTAIHREVIAQFSLGFVRSIRI